MLALFVLFSGAACESLRAQDTFGRYWPWADHPGGSAGPIMSVVSACRPSRGCPLFISMAVLLMATLLGWEYCSIFPSCTLR